MTPRSTVVAISALIRNSSVVITSCISARWKSADTPVSWSFVFLSQNLAIEAPCHSGARVSVNPESRDSGFGASRRPGMTAKYIASIQCAAEAGHGDRHRHQHQCNECNRVILQVGRRGALQH